MKARQSVFIGAVICFSAMVFAVNAFAAVPGDVDGSGSVDLRDVILAIQVCAGMEAAGVDSEADVNEDDKIGLAEAVFALSQLAAKAKSWYKDADGDGYSDGTTQLSMTRPSDAYYEESELIAISGDGDDNDADIHPDAEGKWVPSDEDNPADAASDFVNVDVAVSTTEEVVVEYGIPGMRVAELPEGGDIYDIINISDSGYTSEIGKPQLPAVRRYVAVPEGSAVKVEIVDSDYRDIEGYSVYPVQEPMPDLEDIAEPSFEIDTDLYQTDAFYPSEIVKTEGPVVIRGVSTVILEICPVQFNPVKQTARMYSYMKVKLSFEGGKRSSARKRLRSPSFDRILNRLLLNPQNVFSGKETRAAYSNGDSLLIVTHPNFLDAANTLKSWKIRKGIHTQVRTTGETGNTASAIQAYVKNAYDTWNPPPTYLLLIGDAEFVPCHYQTTHSYHRTPIGTDLYYATVDGSDYFPDISIGRLSVDTSDQADKRVNDIIGYEKNPVTDSSFYEKAAICAYFQHKGGGYAERRFAQTSEDLAIFLSDQGYLGKYSVDRIYYTKSNVYPKFWSIRYFGGGPAGNTGNPIPAYLEKPGFAWGGDRTDIENAVNSGRFLVTHRDHGAEWGWGDPYYRTGHVQALTNGDKLPVVWSINCMTGWFDNETDADSTGTSSDAVHFSEAWERNPNGGAVGVIAATRVSYSNHNDRLVWGWTDAIWQNFISYSPSGTAFDDPVYEMGAVLNYGKYYYATTCGDNDYRKMEFEMFHWFGDPTMQIWTDVPQNLTVSHSSTLSAGAKSLDVTVSQADALICVSKEDEILSREISVAGTTTLSWSAPLEQGDTIYINVTKHNYRAYEGIINFGSTGAVVFPDKNLESAIRTEISKPAGDILVSDLQNLTSFSYNEYGMADEKKITNLEGIQYCTNLTYLGLDYNQISDVSPLAGLTNLTDLALHFNQISDVTPLAGLTNLTYLYLNDNQISDIKPLVDNSGIDSGDIVDLYYGGSGNPLSTTSCMVYIPQLQSRGVNVEHGCP